MDFENILDTVVCRRNTRCTSSNASLLANGGKEVTLRYRFTMNLNWPLGTRVDICA